MAPGRQIAWKASGRFRAPRADGPGEEPTQCGRSNEVPAKRAFHRITSLREKAPVARRDRAASSRDDRIRLPRLSVCHRGVPSRLPRPASVGGRRELSAVCAQAQSRPCPAYRCRGRPVPVVWPRQARGLRRPCTQREPRAPPAKGACRGIPRCRGCRRQSARGAVASLWGNSADHSYPLPHRVQLSPS